MFYTGANEDDQGNLDVIQIGYATSPDGVTWVKRTPSEPVFGPGDTGAWDDLAVAAPVVLQTDTEFVMWYGGTRDFETVAIGVATASFPPAAVPEAAGIRLAQNFPNPFNPQTTILFTLGTRQKAEIAVYDLMGKQISVLANRFCDVGNHSVVWNGKDAMGRAVPSGTYVVRRETESGVEARKVMLVR